MVGAANPTFFRSPLNQRGTKKTWIWQGEKIGGGLDESGAQNQRTRSCLTTCYQQRRETYAGRCVTNRGERRGDCSEIYLHSLPFGARQTEGLMNGLEGGEPDGRRRRIYQQRRETYAGRCVTNRGERRGDCSEIYLHSLPFGARQTEGLMDGLEGGEPDGRRRRKQAVRPTTGEQAHRQKHGRTERWTDKRKLK